MLLTNITRSIGLSLSLHGNHRGSRRCQISHTIKCYQISSQKQHSTCMIGCTKQQLSNNCYTFLKLLGVRLEQDNRSLGRTEVFWMCKMRSKSRKHDKFVKQRARVLTIMGPPIGASRGLGGAWSRVRSVWETCWSR